VKLHDLYSSIIIRVISRIMRLAGHVVRIGGKRNAFRVLVGKPEAETTWKTYAWIGDNIKIP
jgi:hypothetical protein